MESNALHDTGPRLPISCSASHAARTACYISTNMLWMICWECLTHALMLVTLPVFFAGVAGLSRDVVTASHFRTYTTPLNQQSDFINALRAARDFAATASAELGLHIYPYSIFHIFFEPYLNVGRDALLLVGTPCLAVFAVAWAFTGSLWGSALLLGMLGSLLLHLLGAMYLAGIQLNAGEGWQEGVVLWRQA